MDIQPVSGGITQAGLNLTIIAKTVGMILADFSKITARMYVGASINSEDDLNVIAAAGITHIIDAQVERDDSSLLIQDKWQGRYLYDPTADDGQHPKPTLWFQNAIDFATLAYWQQPGKAVVLCHCAAGVNRGPSLAYAILRAQGFPIDVTWQLLRAGRPQILAAYANDAELALKSLGWVL